MIKSKVEIFTSSAGEKFFNRTDCQMAELKALPQAAPNAAGVADAQTCAEFVLTNAAAILEVLKPARKPRTVKAAKKPAKAPKAQIGIEIGK